jgi:hypothetical protein
MSGGYAKIGGPSFLGPYVGGPIEQLTASEVTAVKRPILPLSATEESRDWRPTLSLPLQRLDQTAASG